jgi:hypothetical protein
MAYSCTPVFADSSWYLLAVPALLWGLVLFAVVSI